MSTIEEAQTEAQVVARLAAEAASAEELTPGRIYKIQNAAGGYTTLDTQDYSDRPRRKDGSFTVGDTESLIAYLSKHGITGETEIWSLENQNQVMAVIDSGTEVEAGWQKHRVSLELNYTPEWIAWVRASGGLMDQEGFAEFIEDHAAEVASPSSAEILEIAQSLQVTKGVDFESGKRLSDGEMRFSYRETQTATAGRAGELKIPDTFTLALSPFVGGEQFKVTVAFRYRLNGNNLRLGFKVQDIEKIRKSAFDTVTEVIKTHATENGYLFLNS
ncbi:DUF2303 family protein [Acaricomes phytoseiuli]|uniref:DUF2303 family protein n=1 Tax=Acaricomes phytoseiuli TaxID=291968 RepID=UPI00036D1654|nr:DUF2303 family protein [Acaricomes phytoseiuli]